ncbi:MAG: alkaline phosphatase family protein [Candidatus Hodarchaeota archaeon]
MDKKILVIGLDGARADATRVANTPNIDKLVKNGRVSWHAQTELRSISGPAWTSLLTGVHMEKHMVDGNDNMRKKLRSPTIFKIAKEWNPSVITVAHSNWKPIVTKIIEEGTLDKSSGGESDKKTTLRLVEDIKNGTGDFYFAQLDEIDAAGHKHVYSPDSKKYLKKIEEIDGYIGKIMETVACRPSEEDWLVCLVSDHGGSGRGHGGPTLGELTIIFIVSGDPVKEKGEIPGDEESSPRIVDIVPTIAEFLGIPAKKEWDGRSYL